jgi:hypothetical protein
LAVTPIAGHDGERDRREPRPARSGCHRGSRIHISVKPQGSVAGPPMMGTPAAASRACSAWTSRTWIQIITECPGGSAVCPETSSKPGPRKNTTPGLSGGPNSG